MNKIINFLNGVEKTLRESREEQERIKKEQADETIDTAKSVFDLFDETNRFVDSFSDDKEIKRVTKYIKSRMNKKGK